MMVRNMACTICTQVKLLEVIYTNFRQPKYTLRQSNAGFDIALDQEELLLQSYVLLLSAADQLLHE